MSRNKYTMGQENGKNKAGRVISRHSVGTNGTISASHHGGRKKATGHTTYHHNTSHFHGSGKRGESRTKTSKRTHSKLLRGVFAKY